MKKIKNFYRNGFEQRFNKNLLKNHLNSGNTKITFKELKEKGFKGNIPLTPITFFDIKIKPKLKQNELFFDIEEIIKAF